MIVKRATLSRIYIANVVFFSVLALLLIVFVFDKKYCAYGLAVAFINYLLSGVFYFIQQRRVSRFLGQALIFVVSSTVFRFITVGLLLVWGFKQLDSISADIVVGFILGQIFYLTIQLIWVSKQYVK